jgi:hypothetical protein
MRRDEPGDVFKRHVHVLAAAEEVAHVLELQHLDVLLPSST